PVTRELACADASMRDTAAWIASHHSNWGAALAGPLRARLTQPNLTESDLAQLQHQLAKLGRAPEIQQLLADHLADADTPSLQKRMALGAMAESNLKPPPVSWIQSIQSVLAGNDATLLADA